jgi:hypothetical protein
MTIDHPAIRELTQCPVCSARKDQGALVCWACFRREDMRRGNPRIEAFLDYRERELTR